jgi:hypothetical protein
MTVVHSQCIVGSTQTLLALQCRSEIKTTHCDAGDLGCLPAKSKVRHLAPQAAAAAEVEQQHVSVLNCSNPGSKHKL